MIVMLVNPKGQISYWPASLFSQCPPCQWSVHRLHLREAESSSRAVSFLSQCYALEKFPNPLPGTFRLWEHECASLSLLSWRSTSLHFTMNRNKVPTPFKHTYRQKKLFIGLNSDYFEVKVWWRICPQGFIYKAPNKSIEIADSKHDTTGFATNFIKYFSPNTSRICKCSIWQNSVFFETPCR